MLKAKFFNYNKIFPVFLKLKAWLNFVYTDMNNYFAYARRDSFWSCICDRMHMHLRWITRFCSLTLKGTGDPIIIFRSVRNGKMGVLREWREEKFPDTYSFQDTSLYAKRRILKWYSIIEFSSIRIRSNLISAFVLSYWVSFSRFLLKWISVLQSQYKMFLNM